MDPCSLIDLVSAENHCYKGTSEPLFSACVCIQATRLVVWKLAHDVANMPCLLKSVHLIFLSEHWTRGNHTLVDEKLWLGKPYFSHAFIVFMETGSFLLNSDKANESVQATMQVLTCSFFFNFSIATKFQTGETIDRKLNSSINKIGSS